MKSSPVEESEISHCYSSVLCLLPEHWLLSVVKKVEGNTWLLNAGDIQGFALQHSKRISGAKRSKQNAGETLFKSLACVSSYSRH